MRARAGVHVGEYVCVCARASAGVLLLCRMLACPGSAPFMFTPPQATGHMGRGARMRARACVCSEFTHLRSPSRASFSAATSACSCAAVALCACCASARRSCSAMHSRSDSSSCSSSSRPSHARSLHAQVYLEEGFTCMCECVCKRVCVCALCMQLHRGAYMQASVTCVCNGAGQKDFKEYRWCRR